MSFLSVEFLYTSSELESFWINTINYSYEIGFMFGCFISEKYYTSNIQRKAVIIAYTLTILSSVSLSLFNILHKYIPNFQLIIALGYALSGIGQSLLIIVMVSYATPYIKLYPKSALLPVIVGLLNFSGAVGTLLAYLMTTFKYQNYLNIGLNAILLIASIIISSNMKEVPRLYTSSALNKPEIPFSFFSVSFYTYGVVFGIYSSVLVRQLKLYPLGFYEKICVFQGIYSLSYCFGALIVLHFIQKERRNIGWVIFSFGTLAAGLGLFNINFSKAYLGDDGGSVAIIYLNNFAIGVLDGIIEPLTLHKIVTQSNRPEFFTGLFYYLASISDLMIISCPR